MYNVSRLLKQYLISTITFLAIDFVWLGLAAKNFYDQAFSAFEQTLRWPAALGAYVLLILGINLLVLPRVARPLDAVLYGIYDLTNFAILADWTLRATIVDMVRACLPAGRVWCMCCG